MSSRVLELKQRLVCDSLVFEVMGVPPETRIFRYGDLQRWGFDLVRGTVEGKVVHGLQQRDREEDVGLAGTSFSVDEVLAELPPRTRLAGELVMREGRCHLRLGLEGAEEDAPLGEVRAGELLIGYLRRERLHRLLAALANLGHFAEIVQSNGQEGKARPFEALPPRFRHFLREGRKLLRETGAGRIALAYFGENADRKARYRVGILAPHLSLFDHTIAERWEGLLESLAK